MKILSPWLACLFCFIVAVPASWALGEKKVAVLPFSVHSAENIDYIRQGITDMLSSRISVSNKIEVVNRDAVQAALKETGAREFTLADVYTLGKKLEADFVVWGSITKIGNSLSIDGRLVDVAAYKAAISVTAQSPGMDEVIPRITEFAQKIENHILGVSPAATVPPSRDPKQIIVSRPPPTPSTSRETEIISGMRGSKQGTFTSAVNPDFINAAQPLDRKTFWKSHEFPTEFRGMDIGDVNGDGLNETVMIDANSVSIYQKTGDQFRLIHKLPGKSYSNFVAVDVADINQNGMKEIFVSGYTGRIVESFVVEFRDGKFVTIASDLRWFLRVIDNATGVPLLLGQRMGIDSPFDTPITEIQWREGEYREGKRQRIPEGLSVYGLTLDRLGTAGPEKVITLNQDDYLCIYDQTEKPLSRVAVFGGSDELRWKSDEVFGGSNIAIDPLSGRTRTMVENEPEIAYINLRIITFDTNKDGKREIVIVKNSSPAARTFQRIKLFTSAEVFNLEWDGMGLVENWRTKKISGYVADYQFKDIDNDGENDIVLALVLSTGASVKGRSVIVSYQLKGQQ
ncbi:MAG: FG-GAP-like repeat-containing protein [Syntrophales bacterium]